MEEKIQTIQEPDIDELYEPHIALTVEELNELGSLGSSGCADWIDEVWW